jgi:hypothetical protein
LQGVAAVVQTIVTAVSALAAVGAAFVAARALGNSRRSQDRADANEDGASHAKVDAALSTYGEKFERAFAAIERLEVNTAKHELECAREKAITAERQAAAAQAMADLQRQMASSSRQISHLAERYFKQQGLMEP